MATASPNISLGGLAERLVEDGLITEQIALVARNESVADGVPFVSHLIKSGKVDGNELALLASQEFGLPLFDLRAMDEEAGALDLVGEKLVRKHHALPLFRRGNRLYVAVSDPTNFQALDEIKFNVGISTEAVLVEDGALTEAIERVLRAQESLQMDLGDVDLSDLDIGADEESEETGAVDVDDAPVVRYINKLLVDAINAGASDLHFEPYEKHYRVRFRVDGILKEMANPPLSLAPRLAARLKILARLDISERRVPQDGRMKLRLSKNRAIDFRVSTLPTLYGEKVVLRILDSGSAQLGIEKLGYEDHQRVIYEENLEKPYGMILITGPTGSGKTVSLYTGLNILNREGINISTAEDPAEIVMEGVNQVNINPRAGLTFPAVLRSFLRQDPDVILVGEIRDLETAEIAVKAAQTGHLVLATLHTNDAPQTINRLMNMGVPPFNVASALNLIIAQRLTRKLCEKCKAPVELPEAVLLEAGFTQAEIDDGLTLYTAVGCNSCVDGYKGRTGIYEVLPITEEMERLILREANAQELAAQAAREGVWDLRRSGLKKVKDGIISLEEVNRVTKD
ncbi:MAG: type IV-A pilus assembly ATPase PilB [Gammaproteobacteria bacterium]|nr:type IV-A pilus assembly ATPase PilB [Gammaproteobacteria bacterium]